MVHAGADVQAVIAPLRALCKRMELSALLVMLPAPDGAGAASLADSLARAAGLAVEQGAPLLSTSMLGAAARALPQCEHDGGLACDVACQMADLDEHVMGLQRPPLQARRAAAGGAGDGAHAVLRHDLQWAWAREAAAGPGCAQGGRERSSRGRAAAAVAGEALRAVRTAVFALQAASLTRTRGAGAAASSMAAFFAAPETAVLLRAMSIGVPAAQPTRSRAGARAKGAHEAPKGRKGKACDSRCSTLGAWSEAVVAAAADGTAPAPVASRLLAAAAQARLSAAELAGSAAVLSSAKARAGEEALALTMRAAQAAGADVQQLSAACREGSVLATRLGRPALACALLSRGLGASDQHAALVAAAQHADQAAPHGHSNSADRRPQTSNFQSKAAPSEAPSAHDRGEPRSSSWAHVASDDALDVALGALQQGVNCIARTPVRISEDTHDVNENVHMAVLRLRRTSNARPSALDSDRNSYSNAAPPSPAHTCACVRGPGGCENSCTQR